MPTSPGTKSVFVISPIGAPGSDAARKASLALNFIIRKALPNPEWDVVRADEEDDPSSITNKVIDRIIKSDLIVADLTDHNPNVFYELAVAHGYKKPVVTIMADGQKPPFDVIDQRAVFYDLTDPASVDAAREKLYRSATAALQEGATPSNPLSVHEVFSTAGEPGREPAESQLSVVYESLMSRLSDIERHLSKIDRERRRSSTGSLLRDYSSPTRRWVTFSGEDADTSKDVPALRSLFYSPGNDSQPDTNQ